MEEDLAKAKEERKTKPIKLFEGPYTYKCVECDQTEHSCWMCKPAPTTPKPHLWATYNGEHYTVYMTKGGKTMIKFTSHKVENLPKKIWVPKNLVDKAKGKA